MLGQLIQKKWAKADKSAQGWRLFNGSVFAIYWLAQWSTHMLANQPAQSLLLKERNVSLHASTKLTWSSLFFLCRLTLRVSASSDFSVIEYISSSFLQKVKTHWIFKPSCFNNKSWSREHVLANRPESYLKAELKRYKLNGHKLDFGHFSLIK